MLPLENEEHIKEWKSETRFYQDYTALLFAKFAYAPLGTGLTVTHTLISVSEKRKKSQGARSGE